LAFTAAELAVVRLGNQIEYIFKDVIPPYLSWLLENWKDVFKTIYDYVSTVLTNLRENLIEFFAWLFAKLQGNDYDWEWKGLTDGFESSIKELPKIAEIQQKFDKINKEFSEGTQSNVNRRLDEFQKSFSGKGGAGLFDFGIEKIKGLFGGLTGPGGALSNLFGDGGRIQIQLPQGESSRFLTGGAAAGQEQLAIIQADMAAEQKTQTGIMNAIGTAVGDKGH
jgi:hypothetical protein